MNELDAAKRKLIEKHRAGDMAAVGILKKRIAELEAGQSAAPAQTEPATLPDNGGIPDRAITFAEGMVEGVPIVGPWLRDGANALADGIISTFTPEDEAEEYREYRDKRFEEQDGTRLAGNIAGGVAVGMGTGSAVAQAPKVVQAAFGAGGNMIQRILGGGATAAAIGGADRASRDINETGETDAASVLTGAAIGGTGGAAAPIVGAGLRAGGQKIMDAGRAILDTKGRAGRMVDRAVRADINSGSAKLQPDEFDQALQDGAPVMTVDRGGRRTRDLFRTATNVDEDAHAAAEAATSSRFANQSQRAVRKITDVAGNVDDVGTIQAVRNAARVSNSKLYGAAESNPAAQRMFTPKLQQLMQSDMVQRAIRDVEKESSNLAALGPAGTAAVKNPFKVNSKGLYTLHQKADGSIVYPNLKFWDQVQRNLRREAEGMRINDPSGARVAGDLRKELLQELDGMVPEFADARAGAARAFGAEDSIEAGRKFVNMNRMNKEIGNAIMKMTPEERTGFKIGYASELIDRARQNNDATDLFRVFNSDQEREKLVMAFGEKGAKELEAFVKVENAMNLARRALGNSDTARQLLASGAVGAGVGTYYTGDPMSGAGMGAMVAAARYGSTKARDKLQQQVFKEVGEILTSQDPQAIQKIIDRAATRPVYMDAIEQVTATLQTAATTGSAVGGSLAAGD
jgi:hypothetical protein